MHQMRPLGLEVLSEAKRSKSILQMGLEDSLESSGDLNLEDSLDECLDFMMLRARLVQRLFEVFGRLLTERLFGFI